MNCIDQIIKDSPYLSSFIAILIIAVVYATEKLTTQYSNYIKGHIFLNIFSYVFGFGLPLFSLNFLLLFVWTSKTYFIFISLILVSLTFFSLTVVFFYTLVNWIHLLYINYWENKLIKKAIKDLNNKNDSKLENSIKKTAAKRKTVARKKPVAKKKAVAGKMPAVKKKAVAKKKPRPKTPGGRGGARK